jgi:hypothetical protein
MQAVLAVALDLDLAEFGIVAKLAGAIRAANERLKGTALHAK